MFVSTEYLRPKRGEHMRSLLGAEQALPEELGAPSYEHATIVPFTNGEYPWMAGVLDSEGRYVESSRYRSCDEFLEYPLSGEPEYLDLKVAYLGHFNAHWGHFLADSNTRTWFALQNAVDVDAYVYACKEGSDAQPTGNILEMLELLGIADKLIMLDRPAIFREVVIPERSYQRDYLAGVISMSPLWRRTFEVVAERAIEKAAIPADSCAEKLYLSRKHYVPAKSRSYGTELLDSFFENNGFQSVYPEEISLSELIARISAARVVGSESGAVSINMFFAPESVEHIEMERLVYNDLVFLSVDLARRGPVTHVDACHAIYPVPIGEGPFLFAYTEPFKRFVADRGFAEPSPRFTGRAYLKKRFMEYVRQYRRWNGYGMGIPSKDHLFDYVLFAEAHRDARRELAPWIDSFGSLEGPVSKLGILLDRAADRLRREMGRKKSAER